MENENKRIIEINGVKLEVDLRNAKVIENFKIGDNVKVLEKTYSDYKSHPGIIIGFDNFKERPTIVIAYLKSSYGGDPNIEFLYLNKDSKDFEICPMLNMESIIERNRAIEMLDRKITEKETELAKLKSEKEYFLDKFGQYFEAQKAIDNILNKGE